MRHRGVRRMIETDRKLRTSVNMVFNDNPTAVSTSCKQVTPDRFRHRQDLAGSLFGCDDIVVGCKMLVTADSRSL